MNDEFSVPTAADVQIRGRENAFQLYAIFCGDVTKVSHALNVPPEAIQAMAISGKWDSKLAAIIALKRSADPQDIERAVNRALNFTVAHRFRLHLEKILNRLTDMTPTELESYLLQDTFDPRTGTTKSQISTRPLVDFAGALEKMSAMTYAALCDHATDRSRREEETGQSETSGSIHSAIARAMSELADAKTPTALLEEAQLASGAVIAAKIKVTSADPVTKPYDRGD
jgi:hypothetical protein